MIELFNYVRKLQTSSFLWYKKTIMQRLFKEIQQSYITPKTLPYQTTEVFKYWSLIEFVNAYQFDTNLARTGISFQNNIYIFKLRKMFKICNTESAIIFTVLER